MNSSAIIAALNMPYVELPQDTKESIWNEQLKALEKELETELAELNAVLRSKKTQIIAGLNQFIKVVKNLKKPTDERLNQKIKIMLSLIYTFAGVKANVSNYQKLPLLDPSIKLPYETIIKDWKRLVFDLKHLIASEASLITIFGPLLIHSQRPTSVFERLSIYLFSFDVERFFERKNAICLKHAQLARQHIRQETNIKNSPFAKSLDIIKVMIAATLDPISIAQLAASSSLFHFLNHDSAIWKNQIADNFKTTPEEVTTARKRVGSYKAVFEELNSMQWIKKQSKSYGFLDVFFRNYRTCVGRFNLEKLLSELNEIDFVSDHMKSAWPIKIKDSFDEAKTTRAQRDVILCLDVKPKTARKLVRTANKAKFFQHVKGIIDPISEKKLCIEVSCHNNMLYKRGAKAPEQLEKTQAALTMRR